MNHYGPIYRQNVSYNTLSLDERVKYDKERALEDLAIMALSAYELDGSELKIPLDAILAKADTVPRIEIEQCYDYVARLLEEATSENDKRPRSLAKIIRMHPTNHFTFKGGID